MHNISRKIYKNDKWVVSFILLLRPLQDLMILYYVRYDFARLETFNHVEAVQSKLVQVYGIVGSWYVVCNYSLTSFTSTVSPRYKEYMAECREKGQSTGKENSLHITKCTSKTVISLWSTYVKIKSSLKFFLNFRVCTIMMLKNISILKVGT